VGIQASSFAAVPAPCQIDDVTHWASRYCCVCLT